MILALQVLATTCVVVGVLFILSLLTSGSGNIEVREMLAVSFIRVFGGRDTRKRLGKILENRERTAICPDALITTELTRKWEEVQFPIPPRTRFDWTDYPASYVCKGCSRIWGCEKWAACAGGTVERCSDCICLPCGEG